MVNYREIPLQHSYISCGETNIANSFLNPVLGYTKLYKRSVGFFSSSVFSLIKEGIVKLARNKGEIRLIASPHLSQEDIKAIQMGYDKREKIVSDSFSRDFVEKLDELKEEELLLLVDLIAKGFLDIKIAVSNTDGIYHDKLGILEDEEGNKIAFYGSSNSSLNGYQKNYEKIRIARSWIPGEVESVEDEQNEFDALWSKTHPFVTVYDYKDNAKDNILQVIEKKKSNKNSTGIKLRDYQEEAIKAWVNNEYHGFYVMATGTGKTWTAIYSARELIKEHPASIIICAPYKHLVKQWAEDVEKAFPSANIVMVFSENPTWDKQITDETVKMKYHPETQLIVISTIASFGSDRFEAVFPKIPGEKLLIVDEAHRFTNRDDSLKNEYRYMLGLSATPFSGKSAERGRELMEFFGGQVFCLAIEEALERGFLVPYNYYPIYVHANDEEESKFQYHTQRILSCFKNGVCIAPDQLAKSLRNRLRVIAMAEEKQSRIHDIINHVAEKDHVVVYCGDGRQYDSNGEEVRHIRAVKGVLSEHDYKASQFTASENMMQRMQLVDAFNKGEISALAAIRCLDEGINIPSIKSALILASNDDYREFVQRRGRILRLYDGKKFANIYDVIVLPSNNLKTWALIELRRFREYAKLALNADEKLDELEDLMIQYGCTMEEIEVYDYDEMEAKLDE